MTDDRLQTRTPPASPAMEERLLDRLKRIPMTEWVWSDALDIFAALAAPPTPRGEEGKQQAFGLDVVVDPALAADELRLVLLNVAKEAVQRDADADWPYALREAATDMDATSLKLLETTLARPAALSTPRAEIDDDARALSLIAARKALYEKKRERHDILADDTLTEYERVTSCIEAMEWLESEIRAAFAAATPAPVVGDGYAAGVEAAAKVACARKLFWDDRQEDGTCGTSLMEEACDIEHAIRALVATPASVTPDAGEELGRMPSYGRSGTALLSLTAASQAEKVEGV